MQTRKRRTNQQELAPVSVLATLTLLDAGRAWSGKAPYHTAAGINHPAPKPAHLSKGGAEILPPSEILPDRSDDHGIEGSALRVCYHLVNDPGNPAWSLG